MQYLISLLNNIRSSHAPYLDMQAIAAENKQDEDAHLHSSVLWKAAAQQTAFDIVRF